MNTVTKMALRKILWSCMKICYTERRKVMTALLITVATACLIKETILLYTEFENKNIVFDSIRDYVHRMQYKCFDIANITVFDHYTDEKEVYPICKDTKFWRQSSGTSENRRCLVYSFGIQHRIEVDHALAEMGCQVYSFDPTLPYDDGSVLESGVYFQKILIADINNESGIKGWKMRSLAAVMKSLGHERSIIDILKIDLEFDDRGRYEDRVLNSLLKTNLYKCVRQLKFKIHIKGRLSVPFLYEREKYLQHQMLRLHSVGLRLFKTTESVETNTFEKNLKYHTVQQRASVSWELNYVNEKVSEICFGPE